MRRKPTGTLSGRLIIYFLIVMLVPFILFVSYTLINYDRGIENATRAQAESALEADALAGAIEGLADAQVREDIGRFLHEQAF